MDNIISETHSHNPVKKRVLCVTSNYPRWHGDSTTPFVHHLAVSLKEFEWEVDVLAPHFIGAAREEVYDGVSVKRFRYLLPEKAQTICYQGGALMNLQKNHLNYLKLPLLVMCEWLAIMKLLMSGKYDLLHSHWILPQGFNGVLASIPLRIPHVITVHGSDAFALKGKVLSQFKQFSLTHADAVTVNSSATQQQVLSIAPNLANLNLIPMGVTRAQPTPNRCEDLRNKYKVGNAPLLIFVGRLVDVKGVDDLLNALSILKAQLSNIRLLILGEGPLRSALESLAKELNLVENVVFMGWIESNDIINYLTAADIFIGPSKSTKDGSVEAQGISFIEAMQAGTPVIASNVGGIVDVIQHEETGLLVEQGNPKQIAGSVLRLIQNKELEAKLIRAAKMKAESLTSLGSAEKIANVFNSCIKTNNEKLNRLLTPKKTPSHFKD
ncbi:glycosyltransferase [Shewanella schlegeliana]|uniref:Glycosyltransferase n=1 Tax=Shewanella schlegeliana TaxID=190308 RepID=A0ABS1T0N9_9GAMM|nr:glycosyltransferase [Shewanella schlegeliana]MBL4913820.1 glycosyltransferase [Shewanella schlegeliana]MCL1108795.1 glycosyltransferase [Shewanella schlegeliana]GIU25992.1 glycosyl transferase family 1 [Shewanella schlegeliana]